MRVRGSGFLRFGEALARGAPGPLRASHLARDLDLPPTSIQEWVRQLRFQRALVETPAGYRVDRPRLLMVYTAHRVARLAPAAEVTTSLEAVDIAQAMDEAGIFHTFGMFTAADRWATFEPRRTHQVYVARSNVRRLRTLLPSGDIRVEVFPENLPKTPDEAQDAELPTVLRDGVRVTDAFLTLLDLRAHPEGGAHAQFLERTILRWRD